MDTIPEVFDSSFDLKTTMASIDAQIDNLEQHAKGMDSKMGFAISLINTLGATMTDSISGPARATQPTLGQDKTSASGMSGSPTCPPPSASTGVKSLWIYEVVIVMRTALLLQH